MTTGRQIKAARALLNMDARDLAAAADLSPETISSFETGSRQPHKTSLVKIVQVFERRGIEFTEHEGVRFKANAVEVYEGRERFDDFYEALYIHLAQHGGHVCMSVTDERLLAQYRKDPGLHRKRMKELAAAGRITFRVLAMQGNFTSAYADYRRPALPVPPPTSFYAFGDCLALISFVHDNPPYVVLIQSAPLAAAYRQHFDAVWKDAKPVSRRRSP